MSWSQRTDYDRLFTKKMQRRRFGPPLRVRYRMGAAFQPSHLLAVWCSLLGIVVGMAAFATGLHALQVEKAAAGWQPPPELPVHVVQAATTHPDLGEEAPFDYLYCLDAAWEVDLDFPEPEPVPQIPQPEPVPVVVQPVAEAEEPEGNCYGTSVAFEDDPQTAGEQAARDRKLLFIVTVSGNFEESAFT